MAVPSSGELKLWDTLWNQELGGSQGENSLHSASVYAGFSTPDALSDFYGWSDVEVPSVTTNSITSVTYNSLTLNGNVTNTGNEDVSRGWYFGTTANPYSSNAKTTLSGTQGTGTFSQAKSVTQTTTYYAWAWASNSAGEAVGSRVQATTPAQPFYPTFTNMTSHASWNSGQSDNAGQVYYNAYTGAGNTNANGSGGTRTSGVFVQVATNTNNRSQAGAFNNGSESVYGEMVIRGNSFYQRNWSSNGDQVVLLTMTNNAFVAYGQSRHNGPFQPSIRFYFQYNYSDVRLKTNINYL